MSTTEAPPLDLTREILGESNVFTAWSDGYATGLIDVDAVKHRAYQRGLIDAKRSAFLARWIFAAAAFVGGFIVAVAAFA